MSNLNLTGVKHIAIAMDISGGVSDSQRRAAFQRIDAALSSKDIQLDFWTFDTEIHDHRNFAPYQSGDIHRCKLRYGGGTLVDMNWDFMRYNHILPDLFVMISDGFFEPVSRYNRNYTNTVWGIFEDIADISYFKPSFGTIVRI